MSEVKTLKCDVCEKLRLNDSNHWLEGSFKNDSLVISLLGKLRREPKLHPVRPSLCYEVGRNQARRIVA